MLVKRFGFHGHFLSFFPPCSSYRTLISIAAVGSPLLTPGDAQSRWGTRRTQEGEESVCWRHRSTQHQHSSPCYLIPVTPWSLAFQTSWRSTRNSSLQNSSLLVSKPNHSLVNTCPLSVPIECYLVLQLGSLEQQKLWVEEWPKAVSKQNSILLSRFEKSDQQLDLGGTLASMALSLPAAQNAVWHRTGSCGISMRLQAQSRRRE